MGKIPACTPWSPNCAAKFARIGHGGGCLAADRGLGLVVNAPINLDSLTERSCTAARLPIIGAIKKLSHAPATPHAVIAWLACADIAIIWRRIPEKGDCYNPARDVDITR